MYRQCVDVCTMCRSTWGPRGSALQGGSEPDTGRLQFAAAGHSFRGMSCLEVLHMWHERKASRAVGFALVGLAVGGLVFAVK